MPGAARAWNESDVFCVIHTAAASGNGVASMCGVDFSTVGL